MKRAGLSAISFLLIMVALLTGCGDGGSDAEETDYTSTANEEESGEEVVVQIWGGGTFLKDGEPGHEIAKEINEKYEGEIKVETRYMPWDEYNTALQAAFASDDVPDIFQLPAGVAHVQYASKGWIRPIDDIVSDEWKALFHEGSFVDGKNVLDGETYSWPIQGPSLKMILFYNKDVMENAGLDPEQPPVTWEELHSMAKTVTEQGEGDTYGLIFGGSGLTTVGGLAAGGNLEAFGHNDVIGFNFKTGEYEYSSPAFSDAVKFFKQLQDEDLIFPGSFTMTGAEARTLFANEQAAFFISSYYNLKPIKEEGGNFGVAPPPSQDGNKPFINYDVAYPGVSFVVSSQTENPEAVGTVIEEGIASAEYYEKMIETATALAPMPKLNEDESLHPYPEFTAFAELTDDIMRAMPDTAPRNPEGTMAVYEELGGTLGQPHVNPGIGDIIEMYMLEETDDIDAALKEYDEQLNKNLTDAIDRVSGEGIDVTLDDFIFPNWDPAEDYTKEDLEELK